MVPLIAWLISLVQSSPYSFELNQLMESPRGIMFSLQIIFSAIAALLLLLLHLKHYGRSLAQTHNQNHYKSVMGFNSLRARHWLVYSFIGIGLAIVVSFTIVVLKETGSGSYVAQLVSNNRSFYQTILLLLAVVVAAPIFEECLFRGYTQSFLIQNGVPNWLSIGISSMLWVFIHGQYQWSELSLLFMFGLSLGAIRLYSNNLWAVIALHSSFNLTVLFLVLDRIG